MILSELAKTNSYTNFNPALVSACCTAESVKVQLSATNVVNALVDNKERPVLLEQLCQIYQNIFTEYRKSRTDALAKQFNDIRKKLRGYFDGMLSQHGYKLNSFADLEGFFKDKEIFSDEEFFPAIYLYMQANFESIDIDDTKNNRNYPAEAVFSRKEMDCDDASFFVMHFAVQRGLAEGSSCEWLLKGPEPVPEPDIHVIYLYKRKDGYIRIDNWKYDLSPVQSKKDLMRSDKFDYVYAARTLKNPLELARKFTYETYSSVDYLYGKSYQENQKYFYYIRTRDK